MEYKPNYLWENKHKNFSFVSERHYEVWNRLPNGQKPPTKLLRWQAGLAAVKSILAEAQVNSKKVRACGAGWSLSEAAKCTDYFVETKPLNIIFERPDVTWIDHLEKEHFVIAQCGAEIMEINTVLKARGLALPTSGASDGQTIVGAISTGTHGAAFKFGSLQDCVCGIHLVTESDKHFWIEPNERQVSDVCIQELAIGAVRVNNDELFNATLVSFGSFGIIHALVLKCVPLFKMAVYNRYFDLNKVRTCIDGPGNFDHLNLPPDPDTFEVIINPYRLDQVVTRTMYIKRDDLSDGEGEGDDVSYGLSPDVIGLLGSIAGRLPAAIPAMIKLLHKSMLASYPLVEGKRDFPGTLFSGGQTSFNGPVMSAEIGVDAAQSNTVLNIILKQLLQEPLPGLIALRYVKKSRATLAFTNKNITCTIELPTVLSGQTGIFYKALWARLEANTISFTFHWGQCSQLNETKVRQKWGDEAVDSWLKARNYFLPTNNSRTMFSNDFIEQCGLNKDLSDGTFFLT